MSSLACTCTPSYSFYLTNIFLISWCSPRTSWEFVWSIGYEHSIITGKRKLTWTSPVCIFNLAMTGRVHSLHCQLYIGARWLTLVLVTIEFGGFDARHLISCQVWGFIGPPGPSC